MSLPLRVRCKKLLRRASRRLPPASADLIDEGASEGGGLDAAAPGAASVLARQAAAADKAQAAAA
jgi:hypothetical protein